jgi:hypothetical protein
MNCPCSNSDDALTRSMHSKKGDIPECGLRLFIVLRIYPSQFRNKGVQSNASIVHNW